MSGGDYLTNQFLIAMPTLGDPNFFRTVTYICEHTAEGALGIVINRPTELKLREIFDQLDLELASEAAGDQPVFRGGPVQQDRGFVLHQSERDWDSTLVVGNMVRVTTSRDILCAMARGDGPQRSLVALGYAGWDAGQLEAEIAANAWLSVTADVSIIFETPAERRWEAATRLLGIDPLMIASDAGHA